MKKIFLYFFLMVFFSSTYAIDESCFEYSGKISPVNKETIKVITDDINNYYFQDGKLLNSKILSSFEKQYFPYTDTKTNMEYTTGYFNFDQYEERKQILIKFQKTLSKNSFDYFISTDNLNYHFEISKDGITWHKIEDDLRKYDLDYVKISFDNDKLAPTTVQELSFYKNGNNEILLNSESTSEITAYNGYSCSDDELTKLINKTKTTQYFPVTTSTKTISLELKKNPQYNPEHVIAYLNRDTDNDRIIDTSDNCPNDYNPDQLDSRADGIGDMCSDKDFDGILGKLDNCSTISNPDQKDDNKNGIGDACEIDSDGDSVFDSVDNCKMKANPDQYDSDGDSIGDMCDNCSEIFNVDQKNVDQDGLGDMCDTKDDRYIESNKNFFAVLILSIIVIFIGGIFIMVKKIKSLQK